LILKKVGGTNLIRFAWFVDLGQFRVNGLALKKVGGTDLALKKVGGTDLAKKVGGTDLGNNENCEKCKLSFHPKRWVAPISDGLVGLWILRNFG
jgi:hypothetical protein